MPVYKFIQYGDYYSKTLGSLWNYCRYEPFLSDASDSVGFTSVDFSDAFNFKQKITGKAGDDGTKDIEVMVSLKNLTKFQSILEISLINSEINLILTWSANCIIKSRGRYQATTFAITEKKAFFTTGDIGKLSQIR